MQARRFAYATIARHALTSNASTFMRVPSSFQTAMLAAYAMLRISAASGRRLKTPPTPAMPATHLLQFPTPDKLRGAVSGILHPRLFLDLFAGVNAPLTAAMHAQGSDHFQPFDLDRDLSATYSMTRCLPSSCAWAWGMDWHSIRRESCAQENQSMPSRARRATFRVARHTVLLYRLSFWGKIGLLVAKAGSIAQQTDTRPFAGRTASPLVVCR